MNSLIVIFISIFFSAFFSGMEIAYISSNKLKVELDKQSNSISARLLQKVLNSPSNYLATILVGNNISLVIYGITMVEILDPIIISFAKHPLYTLLFQTFLSTFIILVTAEFIPKFFVRINPNRFLNVLIFPLTFFHIVLFPIVFFILLISKKFLKLFGLSIVEDSPIYGKVDLEEYLKLYTREIELEKLDLEVQILQNALDFSNVKLRECMLPRTEIVAIELSKSIDELLKIFIDTKLSKVLIYKDNIDNIVGYVHSNEMFKSPKTIKSVLIPISYVPESMMANEMLEIFIRHKKGVAVVIDEFGGTSGMLTLEDVVEEILGEIEDEYDFENDLEVKIDEFNYRFSARLEIDYLNDKYNLNLPKSKDYETLGGMLINYLEEIPKKETQICIANYDIKIDEVSDTKIESVRLLLNDES